MSSQLPLVSVCMITYQHEKFIAKAIEGVLSQHVQFEVELVIFDDNSDDGTSEIVAHYIENHPNGKWINYHKNKNNIGFSNNFKNALTQCKGEIIALCEGDDFWIDNSHLNNQYDIFSKNSKFTMSGAYVKIMFDDGENLYERGFNPQLSSSSLSHVSIDRVLTGEMYFSTVSRVYHSEVIHSFLMEVDDITLFCDWLLSFFAIHYAKTNNRKIFFGNYISGVYRQTEFGVWHNKSKLHKVEKDLDILFFVFKKNWNIPLEYLKNNILSRLRYIYSNREVKILKRIRFFLNFWYFRFYFFLQ